MYYKKAFAFIKKDFLIESGYKMAFAITILNSIFPVFTYFFLNKLISEKGGSLVKYGGNYFSFALVGIAFTSYFTLAVGTFSTTMRRSQMAGCLEAILSSQTSTTVVVIMSSFYSFISALFQLLLSFVIGAAFLGFNFSKINIISTLIIFFLGLIIFISFGIVSAAGTILFKQGEPFGWILGGLSSLIGGAVFPISVMPHWLQVFSMILPITYVLDALRLAMLSDYSISMLLPQISLLCGIAALLFPLSLRFFKWAVIKGKKDGTLMQY